MTNALDVLIAIGILLLAMSLIAILRWRRRQNFVDRVRTNLEFSSWQAQDYTDAKNKLKKLKIEIERKTNGARVIDLVHDLGEFRFERDNTSDHVNFEQAIEVQNAINSAKKDQPIVLIVQTLGGYSLAAELIAKALKAHPGPTSVYVPSVAMSAGTLIALAADKIYLGKNGCLGPIDTQYGNRSFADLEKLKNFKKERTSDEILLQFFEAETREKTIKSRLSAILDSHHKGSVIDALLRPDRPHDYPIQYGEAKDIGINVVREMPKEVFDYVELREILLKRYKEAIQFSVPTISATSPKDDASRKLTPHTIGSLPLDKLGILRHPHQAAAQSPQSINDNFRNENLADQIHREAIEKVATKSNSTRFVRNARETILIASKVTAIFLGLSFLLFARYSPAVTAAHQSETVSTDQTPQSR